MSEIRLSKLMADRGLCSRREADKLIQKGLVRVDNNVISKLGTRVDPNANISLSPEAIRARERLVTLIVNKPPGYVSTQPEKGYLDVRSLIIPTNQYVSSHQSENDLVRSKSLHTAGRLDIDSSGLVVLTQDGTIVRRLIHPSHPVSKEYIVTVKGVITESAIENLREGLVLDGRRLRQAEVFQTKVDQLKIVLRQGRNRQIRRMCELVELEVRSLVRIRIGNLCLDDLPRGKWRFMTRDESF